MTTPAIQLPQGFEEIKPVELWSFSSLQSIESCPRSFWLGERAAYPQLWNRIGYPYFPHLSAIKGSIIHSVVQRIFKEGRGQMQKCSNVVKNLGGLRSIIELEIASYFEKLHCAPQHEQKKLSSRKSINKEILELRSIVQQLLSKIVKQDSFETEVSEGHQVSKMHFALDEARNGALATGTYAEFYLENQTLKFKGIADLMIVSDSSYEIIELKTGQPEVSHVFQVQCYLALWGNSPRRNQTKNLQGWVIYAHGTKERVSDSESELNETIEKLQRRISSAEKTSDENFNLGDWCRRCRIRQNCSAYWQSAASQFKSEADFEVFGSIDRSGQFAGVDTNGQQITFFADNQLKHEISGQFRILNGRKKFDEDLDNQVAIVSFGENSEIFLVQNNDSD